MSATSTAVTSYARHALRLAFAATTLTFATLLLGGHTHAADAPPADAATESATPAPNDQLLDPTGSTPTQQAPAAQAPADQSPSADASANPPAADTAATDPGSAGASAPTPAADPAATGPGPTDTNNQNADTTTTGTGVANTGGNTGVGNTTGGPATTPCPTATGITAVTLCTTDPTVGAGVDAGNASAQGNANTNGITQQVGIQTHANGQVDVLQVALVINIGVGLADSGSNAAGATGSSPFGVAGIAGVGTGNSDVIGLQGDTSVIQGATIYGGLTSGQTVTVLNIGLGVGNTGLNLAIGSVAGGGNQEVAAAGPPANGQADVTTGGANAVGNQTGSLIVQIVTVTADDNGRITVTQRAVIVNFGLAIANSGANTAASGLAALPAAQQSMVESLIAALFGIDPSVLFGGGNAGIGTGNAHAVGDLSQSSILQRVDGGVTGTDAATADQSAWIGNFGAALANTGLNGAIGVSTVLPDGSPMASAEQTVMRFLDLLFHPEMLQSNNAELTSALDLGAALLNVKGDISATELLAGLDESGAFESGSPGIRVRQLTGVLNIGISLANSGDNLALSSVAGANPGTLDPRISQVLGQATILTGDTKVLGERAHVVVCQIKGNETALCGTPTPPPPVPPPAPNPNPASNPAPATPEVLDAATPAAKAVASGSLPFTGAPLTLEALFGLSLTGGGLLVQRRTRRGR